MDATPLPGGGAIAVAKHPSGELVALPLVPAGGGRWRSADAGDGASAALVAVLAGRMELGAGFRMRSGPTRRREAPLPRPGGAERAIGVDQTNRSVVVDERVVVKWIAAPGRAGERAPRLLRHLAAVGFTGAPALYATLEWAANGSEPVTLALLDAFLPEAEDGWDWAPDAVRAHAAAGHACDEGCPARFAVRLGALAAELHVAFATPGPEIAIPVAEAGTGEVARWLAAAERTLDEALALTRAEDPAAARTLGAWEDGLRARIRRLEAVGRTLVQPVHGDLHVGQLPRWRGGIAVIDFDGNPTLPDVVRLARQPGARDLAQLLLSLDHVGQVAIRRAGEGSRATIEAWARDARTACLEAYRTRLAAAGRPELLDPRLLEPFLAEQACRELVYAARFLPRWRYAPMGAIRAMVEA